MESINKKRMESLYKSRKRLDKKLRIVEDEIERLQHVKQTHWLHAHSLSEDIRFYRNKGDAEGIIRCTRGGNSSELMVVLSSVGRLESIQDGNTKVVSKDDDQLITHMYFLRFLIAIASDYEVAKDVLIIND